MAEGEGYQNPAYDPDDYDPDDDDEENEETTDETNPLIPGDSSTQEPPAEQIEMKELPKEKESGLPSYAEKTSDAQSLSQKAWEAAKNVFPNISGDLEVFYNPKGRLLEKNAWAGQKSIFLVYHKKGYR